MLMLACWAILSETETAPSIAFAAFNSTRPEGGGTATPKRRQPPLAPAKTHCFALCARTIGLAAPGVEKSSEKGETRLEEQSEVSPRLDPTPRRACLLPKPRTPLRSRLRSSTHLCTKPPAAVLLLFACCRHVPDPCSIAPRAACAEQPTLRQRPHQRRRLAALPTGVEAPYLRSPCAPSISPLQHSSLVCVQVPRFMLNAQALAAGQAPSSWPGAVPDASKVVPGSSPPLVAGSSLGGQDIPASGNTSASSQQTSLFPRFSPEAAELYGSSAVQQQAQQQAAAQQQQQQAQALKQNLQKLYGSLGLQHGSRSSLPDIQEHEPQMRVPSDPPRAQRLPPYGRPPAARALSDEDLFGMQDMGQQAAAAAAAHASHGGAGMQSMPPPPPAADDLSLVGQMPAGASQSRTLFVRNIDASVPDDELRTLFEVGPAGRDHWTLALMQAPVRLVSRLMVATGAWFCTRFEAAWVPPTFWPDPCPLACRSARCRRLVRCAACSPPPRGVASWRSATLTRGPPRWQSIRWQGRCCRGSSWTSTSRCPRMIGRLPRWVAAHMH